MSPLGLPEAAVFSAGSDAPPPAGHGQPDAPLAAGAALEHLQDLPEAMKALRGYVDKADLTAEELQPLVGRSLQLAVGAPLHLLAELADLFRALRLRRALRELMPVVSAELAVQPFPCLEGTQSEAEAQALRSVLSIASSMGKGSLFYVELFDFCYARLPQLDPRSMAIFMYEAGRHGLRCRHLMDVAVGHGVRLVPNMTTDELLLVIHGLARFSKDWKEFIIAARPYLVTTVPILSVAQVTLLLRVAKDLRYQPEFTALHAACASELTRRAPTLSLPESALALMHCSYSPQARAQVHGLARAVEQLWSRTEDLSPLRVVEVVDALEVFASWGMRPFPLVDRLDGILVDRTIELKHAGNVSLWTNAVQALSQMGHRGAKWPLTALELARDKAFVERVSFFQQSTLVRALSRQMLFDEAVYNNIADLLLSDMELFKEVKELAAVVYAFASVGHFHQQLFDRAYDMLIGWLESETLDMTQARTHDSVIWLTWCMGLAGYHKNYDSFAALLDYCFHGRLEDERALNLRRLAHLADMVYHEAPTLAEKCQYTDRLAQVRSQPSTRRVVQADPAGDPKLLREVKAALQEANRGHRLFAEPDPTSPFLVAVALEGDGQKAGLQLAGQDDSVHVGLPSEGLAARPGGEMLLARRLLAARGWRIGTIFSTDWAAVAPERRLAFLEQVLSTAG